MSKNRILDGIGQTAAQHGERIAVVTGTRTLTYRALWQRSDLLAAWLDGRLGEDRTPILVYGHKDPELLVCFLACIKSGRAYCPVDSSMPQARVEEIASALGNRLVLATEPLTLPGRTVASPAQICDGAQGDRPYTAAHPVAGDDTFYIIFTSGSTGRPKGVEITARNLQSYLDWSRALIAEKTGAAEVPLRFLNQAPLSFDLSVMDLYNALTMGGTLVCLTRSMQADAGALLRYLTEMQPQVWVSTPSFADLCLADRGFCGAVLDAMRLFLFCGERLTKDTAGKLLTRFPDARVVNTYGPTECTVCVTQVEIEPAMLAADGTLPIGAPKAGTEILFDGTEMLITGDTVAKGYFGDAERTDRSFVWVTDRTGRRVRGYRTGDSGYVQDGQYYYNGRIDKQVKLHGYRIELGDIEANLEALPEVEQAVCVPCTVQDRIRYLAAFVRGTGRIAAAAPADGPDGGAAASDLQRALQRTLRAQLRDRLPAYMVPKRIFFVDAMPVTPGGKLDRRQLEERLR